MELADLGFVLINAVVLACIYGTLAIGISITWSSVGLINLAYGFIYAAAGYGAWMTAQHITGNGAMVLAAGVLTGALAGLFVCALAFIPIHDKPNFPVRGMIATLAISLIGMQTLLWVFGPLSKSLPEIFGSGSVMLGDTALTADKIGNVLVSIGFVTAVVMWMRSSRRGLEIRAMMMNPHAAAIVGIGVRRTGFYVMAITGAMAGLAAVLLSQTYYISPFGGLTPMIKGVSIALCGGLGSVQGAIIAAVILGLNEALTSVVLGGQYVLITQFLLIIVILLIRPRGIAGIVDRAREA
ncbi:branched-chain amino acid ABC transporter permease [Verminephrobacter eiseniae]|uniref:branched-chain amino acid ABC transporter permease n=1 Tax=Verminephrobacter eiseniae TaxID=364317 RepID=UPI00223803E8|nr:branched-chain amino acid ABC transporter permease [Verminephrobacter eiseniae]MCW5234738.1 branched-chain amino acid ABC transporter permease [Verminephrobacter eiseniae]MCW5293687.1 branched-chain amino acid ABC transporter permease [Verminephrobacter eiseniae]MCW8183478.1 branched-chain amino acid ABC transporter permease [Verminephrobacter eiseniae]MCW8224723.1 branched-chain amino acid ABC transporter permease [Verminephrobacter eiseniae]MCW8235806.1 branched-chain amino acid ABC trans